MSSATVEPGEALFADLYELTMAAAYLRAGMTGAASFELFVRSLPPQRRFLVVAGVEEVLDHLGALHVEARALDELASLGRFDDEFLGWLETLRFEGDVWAVPEGEVAFAGEPLVRVSAPLPVAQLVETYLLNAVASNSLVASKAARVHLACRDRGFVDFSARRDHGAEAAMQAARAAWIAGAAATSLVVAGQRYGIPLSGTMAHSFVMAHDDEREAFRNYARAFPDGVVLLIDTYDTLHGARNVVEVAAELAGEGIRVEGVRLDSGDLASLARGVREVLDAGDLHDVSIFASGDLDEHRIAGLRATGAPIDAFGVGTQLGTSADAPALGAVYKLVELEGGPRVKLSEGKATLPGRKQVWRLGDRDVISLHDESIEGGRPLLRRAMACGRRTEPAEPLSAARERCLAALAALPPACRRLEPLEPGEVPWPVAVSPGLTAMSRRARLAHGAQAGGARTALRT